MMVKFSDLKDKKCNKDKTCCKKAETKEKDCCKKMAKTEAKTTATAKPTTTKKA